MVGQINPNRNKGNKVVEISFWFFITEEHYCICIVSMTYYKPHNFPNADTDIGGRFTGRKRQFKNSLLVQLHNESWFIHNQFMVSAMERIF